MPSADRNRITAWYSEHGDAVRNLLKVNHELYLATDPWRTTPEDILRDRTMTAARDLLAAVEAVPLIGVPAVGQPLESALTHLRDGAGMLTSLPLELDAAAAQVMEAAPVPQAGYDGIGVTTQAVLGFGPA